MQDLLNFYQHIHLLHSHSWFASRQLFCCKLMTNFSSVQIPCSLLQHKDKFHCHIRRLSLTWNQILLVDASDKVSGWLHLHLCFRSRFTLGLCSYPDPTSSVSHVTGVCMGLHRHWMAYHLIRMVNSVSRVPIKATGEKLWTAVWDEASSFSR